MKALIRSHSSTYCSYSPRLLLVGPIVFDTPCTYGCGGLADCFAVTVSLLIRGIPFDLLYTPRRKCSPQECAYIHTSVCCKPDHIIRTAKYRRSQVHIYAHRLGTGLHRWLSGPQPCEEFISDMCQGQAPFCQFPRRKAGQLR